MLHHPPGMSFGIRNEGKGFNTPPGMDPAPAADPAPPVDPKLGNVEANPAAFAGAGPNPFPANE